MKNAPWLPRTLRYCSCGALILTLAPLGILAQRNAAGAAHERTDSRFSSQPAGADEALLRAMRDEMARSMKDLRLGELDRPYFIGYQVTEGAAVKAAASRSSMLSSEEVRMRVLGVEVRVGDYAFDNTNFFGGASFAANFSRSFFGSVFLPLDDDYGQIRRQFWLATDGAYKRALESIAGKRAALQNATRSGELPDFTKEEPTHTREIAPAVAPDRAGAEQLVRSLSGVLAELPGLYTSSVQMDIKNQRTLYLNSEGTSYEKTRPLITLTAGAFTQAVDGMPLSDSLTVYARSLAEFPARDQLAERVRKMAERLEGLRQAPLLGNYNGPVLFDGRAASELFSSEFAPALLAKRKPVSGQPGFGDIFGRMADQGGSLANKLGARVLPDFLTVTDDPSAAVYDGVPLMGGYTADDEGVPARTTRLVENGILRTLLSTRNPVEGVSRSTANRRGGGAAPSNLIVTSSKGLNREQLKGKLLELVKQRGLPYGVIISDIRATAGEPHEQAMEMFLSMTGRGGEKSKGVLCAHKLYPDGHQELVRGVHISGIGLETFKGILAASGAPFVYTSESSPRFDFASLMTMALSSEGMSQPIVSYAVPALLFEDLTLTKATGQTPKPPLSDPPGTAK